MANTSFVGKFHSDGETPSSATHSGEPISEGETPSPSAHGGELISERETPQPAVGDGNPRLKPEYPLPTIRDGESCPKWPKFGLIAVRLSNMLIGKNAIQRNLEKIHLVGYLQELFYDHEIKENPTDYLFRYLNDSEPDQMAESFLSLQHSLWELLKHSERA